MEPANSNEKYRVLLFGLGAIGSFYAFILNRCPNVSLSVVARSNYDKVKNGGLNIDSIRHGQHNIMFENVYRTPDEAILEGGFDFIICCNKAVNPTAVPPLFRQVTTSQTVFVIIQNGVGNEEFFQSVYPHNTVLSCVIWVHAIQVDANSIKHMKPENTELGLHRNELLPEATEHKRLETFRDLLLAGGTHVDVPADIQIKRWEKVVWNSAWNPITMLTMVDTAEWLKQPEANTVTRRLFTEVISVGRAAGVGLRYELVDELMTRINAIGGLSASMATDAREGRPLELEVILGVPFRKAQKLGVDVPTLSTLYALTQAVHERLCRAQAR